MRKIHISIFFMLILGIGNLTAQKNNILLTINNHEINKEEFLRIYNKNNKNLIDSEESTIDEYIDLFINFKLKVIEAQKMGLDTLESVRKEINKYKKELAKPYLVDTNALNHLIEEAYNRLQYEVNASHILIKMPQKASAEDTLFAYNKILNIKKKRLKEDDFNKVALATSDDPSAKRNKGNLGYFSALQMVYPFESAVYDMEIGEISNPVKTKYGYHLIKKHDQRKARGKVKVAHIMLLAPERMKSEEIEKKKDKINQIYHEIKRGADFGEMAKKYSEDKSSSKKGGELPWFGVGRMVPEFEKIAFQLTEKGQISKPFKTKVGWHIIKLIDKDKLGTFEEEKKELKKKVISNPRYNIAQDSLIKKLKVQYHYQLFPDNLSEIKSYVDTDNQKVKWDSLKNNLNSDKPLFSIKNKKITQQQFIRYLLNQEQLKKQYSGNLLIDKAFIHFKKESIIDYEFKRLPAKYPDYKYITKEYHDGILLFEIMDRKIWRKATEDTAGLKKFHESHKKDYMWDERYKGKIYICENKNILDKVKKMKKGGLFKKKYSDQELLNEIDNKYLKIEKDTYSKGESPIIDKVVWNIKRKIPEERRFHIVEGEKIDPQPKSLEEARGQILSDYQDYLEKQWIKKLRKKYTIEVHEEVLKQIKN